MVLPKKQRQRQKYKTLQQLLIKHLVIRFTKKVKKGIRVVDVSHGPKIEISFAGNGTINGTIAVTDIGTIWTLPTSPDGMNLYSQGQGVLTTEQGAMATYTQQASGEITSDGRVLFQGSMFFSASPSQTGELAFLDNLVGVYTYESDLAGNAERVVWERT